MRNFMQKLFALLHVVFVLTAIGLFYKACWMILQKTTPLVESDYMIIGVVLFVNSVIAMEIGNGKNRKEKSEVSESGM